MENVLEQVRKPVVDILLNTGYRVERISTKGEKIWIYLKQVNLDELVRYCQKEEKN